MEKIHIHVDFSAVRQAAIRNVLVCACVVTCAAMVLISLVALVGWLL